MLLLQFSGGKTEAERGRASLADQVGLLICLPFYFPSATKLVLAASLSPAGKWILRTPLTCCSSRQDVKYLAISGFLFLRFFAPAILTPKLFDLRDQHADPQTSRSLLLLARVPAVGPHSWVPLAREKHGGKSWEARPMENPNETQRNLLKCHH